MSVNAVDFVIIEPIFRKEGERGATPALYARWRSALAVVGDGSGGTADHLHNFPPRAAGVLGSHALWTFELFGFRIVGNAPTYGLISIVSAEFCQGIQQLNPYWSLDNVTTNYQNRVKPQKFYYKFATDPSVFTNIHTQWNNDPANQYYSWAAGYIWDEEKL